VVDYINVKQKVVRQPIANYIVVEYSVAVKQVVAEDMLRPLSIANEYVVKHGYNFDDEEMLVEYCVVTDIVAVKYVEVEDMLRPLSLTKDIVMMRSSDNGNTGREEVLVKLTEHLEVFPPTQRHMKYEVAKKKGVEKYIVRIKLKDKEVK
jgi:hypothetical protein